MGEAEKVNQIFTLLKDLTLPKWELSLMAC